MIEKADNLTKAQKEELFKRIQQLHKNLIDKRIIKKQHYYGIYMDSFL